MTVGVLDELGRDRPEVGFGIDVTPSHLQQLAPALRRVQP
jgi:hypothetical protein